MFPFQWPLKNTMAHFISQAIYIIMVRLQSFKTEDYGIEPSCYYPVLVKVFMNCKVMFVAVLYNYMKNAHEIKFCWVLYNAYGFVCFLHICKSIIIGNVHYKLMALYKINRCLSIGTHRFRLKPLYPLQMYIIGIQNIAILQHEFVWLCAIVVM